MIQGKTFARLVGTVPGPPSRRRWWQWCPPWCAPRTPPRVRWESYPVPCIMDRVIGGRTSNVSTLAWGGPWPDGLELAKVEVADGDETLLFWFTLNQRLQRSHLHASDTIQVSPGDLVLRLD